MRAVVVQLMSACICLGPSVNQLYNNKKMAKLFFFPLLGSVGLILIAALLALDCSFVGASEGGHESEQASRHSRVTETDGRGRR